MISNLGDDPAGCPSQTVNQHYYIEVLKQLRENIRRKKGQKWEVMDCYCTMTMQPLSVKQFLTSKDTNVMWHPPYLPDLAPLDCFFFNFVQLNLVERETILPQLKRFRQKWKISQIDIRKPHYRTVTSNEVREC
ncbi:hypothetical protein TNCV_2334251 [Trichonephila clavipes]|nr:hypothetical protein TNCV_2334251 [Trichonephila clavipes]